MRTYDDLVAILIAHMRLGRVMRKKCHMRAVNTARLKQKLECTRVQCVIAKFAIKGVIGCCLEDSVNVSCVACA